MTTQSNSPQIQMRLELIPVPVADIDRAKAFYEQQLGFHVDHDVSPNEGARIVQLTPHGSACSIVLGKGVGNFDQMAVGGVQGLHLVVTDIDAARKDVLARGVDIGEIIDMGGIKFAHFADPDGNTWLFQEIPAGR